MKQTQAVVLPAAILASLLVVALGVWASPRMASPQIAAPEGQAAQEPGPEPVQAQDAASAPVDPAGEGCAVSGNYPAQVLGWCELITRYAREYGLDPDLVAAVMLRESNGDPQAYSKNGAVGLLQVMPRDGLAAKFNCAGGPCFANRPSIQELQDPDFNVAYGVRMLAGLTQELGDLREALKAYGPIEVEYRYADYILQTYNSYR